MNLAYLHKMLLKILFCRLIGHFIRHTFMAWSFWSIYNKNIMLPIRTANFLFYHTPDI